MIPLLLWSLFALAGLGAANRMLEDAPLLPDGWKKIENRTVNPDQKVRFSFALRQPHSLSVERKIESSSHLSRAQAQAFRNPNQEDVDAVLTWLSDNGLTDEATTDRDWIHLKTTVVDAESLLDMVLSFYQFEDQAPVLRTREYSVPEEVFDAIDFVYPIANFMRPKKELTSPSEQVAPEILEELSHEKRDSLASCDRIVTPACLLNLYNISYETPDDTSSIRFGIAGFLEENANYQDSNNFLKTFAPALYQKGYNYSTETLNGGQNSQVLSKSGGEAALDVQYAMGVGFPTNIVYYLAGGRGVLLDDNGKPKNVSDSTNEPYLEFVQYLLDKPDDELPHVLSVSYADDELSVPRAYAQRVCALLGMLTARGTTILVASGDGGTRGSSNSNCRTNDGSNRDVAMAVFPATCPWVTSVGAVNNGEDPPEGAEFSGGGFSQYFRRPRWQNRAVSSYVRALDGQMGGYYSQYYRAVPDISAVGTNFLVRNAGRLVTLRGTSASAPVIAAMISLINDARVRRGMPVLGWLNRRLYSPQVQAALQDVVDGEAYQCDFSKGADGWIATKGWDAVTGLGVPYDFRKFLNVLVKMR